MRAKIFLVALPFAGVFFLYLINSYQTMTGPHGGTFKSAQNYNIEVKTIYPFIYSYLLDNKKKPIKNEGITCEINFLLSDTTVVDIEMKPYRKDGFVMEANSMIYNSFRVRYRVLGKSVSAVFENESSIVQKNQSIVNN